MAELRRRARRYPLPLPLRYRIAKAAEWLSGTTRNVSDSGILFSVDQALEIGTAIEVELAMEANGERWPSKAVAQASVVRVVGKSSSAPAEIAARFTRHEILPRPAGQV